MREDETLRFGVRNPESTHQREGDVEPCSVRIRESVSSRLTMLTKDAQGVQLPGDHILELLIIRQSNLRLLCPNCHAQTNTYRGKNKRSCGETGETRRT